MRRKCRSFCGVEQLELRRLLSTIYVDAIAPGPTHDGSSWANAYTDLQSGLSAATSGTTIEVGQGTYYPTPGSDRTISFNLESDVGIYGGYAGYGAADPDELNVTLYPSILSGDIGIAGNKSDNSFHVVTSSNYLSSTTVLSGFTITAGNGNSGITPFGGGGMYNYHASPTLSNCTFTGNWGYEGGGIYNVHSSPTVTGCTFSGNDAYEGGGMFNANFSDPTLTTCAFTGNVGSYGNASYGGGGGGVYDQGSSPKLTGCIFTANKADAGDGAGMYNDGNSSSTLANCTFTENGTNYHGGGIYGTSFTITNTTFTDNIAGYGGGAYCINSKLTNCNFDSNRAFYGGGIYAEFPTVNLIDCIFSANWAEFCGGGVYSDNSTSTVTNCTFSENTAGNYGGAIYNNSQLKLINCTLTGNSAGTYGGGLYNDSSSSATFVNCILWKDTASLGGNEIYNKGSAATVTYSDIQGGYTGAGNIDADPLFVDLSANDLHVQLYSPVLDAGNNSPLLPMRGVNGITTDLDGNPRIFDFPGVNNGAGPLVDMGAYELGYNLDQIIVPTGQTLALPAGDFTFSANSLFIGTDSKLDIGNDTLEIQYTAGNDPASSIASLINTAFATGTWTGKGITSSSIASDTPGTTAVGYFDTGSQVAIRRSWVGDANLDGVINADDLSLMLLGQAEHETRWQDGNFNYDTQVDADDWIKFMYVNAYANQQMLPAAAPSFANTTLASADQLGNLLD